MTLPEQHLESISERDIDLLLLEELSISPDFARWFAFESGLTPSEVAELVGVWHSVSDVALGESDLVALFRSEEGKRSAVLIENKVNAPAQPDQGERYGRRGEAGARDGSWDQYTTCIVAPARYLGGSQDAPIYEAQIAYEQIRNWLRARSADEPRASYRARVLDLAIRQQRRGYSPVIDDHMTAFWRRFWETSKQQCPRLEMKEPGSKPAGAGWIWVAPSEIGEPRWIAFKLEQGFVDLWIPNAAGLQDQIDAICVERLGGEARAVRTGKSASLRVEVEPIQLAAGFEAQLDEIDANFRAAERLMDAWKQVREEIEALILEER